MANDKKELTVEEQVAELAGRVENLEKENVTLGEANAKLTEDNQAMAKEIAEWKGVTKAEKPKEAEKPTVPKAKFKVENTEYKFKVAKFNLPGFGVMTAKDALNNKEALARLVEIKSSIIEEC